MTVETLYKTSADIIPYQELLGNYDQHAATDKIRAIIPYQELLGNYDLFYVLAHVQRHYTIPRAIREL